jgi:hypothetical protein
MYAYIKYLHSRFYLPFQNAIFLTTLGMHGPKNKFSV